MPTYRALVLVVIYVEAKTIDDVDSIIESVDFGNLSAEKKTFGAIKDYEFNSIRWIEEDD